MRPYKTQETGQHDAPALSAGKLGAGFVRIVQTELCQNRFNPVGGIPCVVIGQNMLELPVFRRTGGKFLTAFQNFREISNAFTHRGSDGNLPRERKVLRHVGNPDIPGVRDFSGGRRIKSGNDFHQCGLPASVTPDQRHALMIGNGKRGIVEEDLAPDFEPESVACPENPVRHARSGQSSKRSSSIGTVRFSRRERSAAKTMRWVSSEMSAPLTIRSGSFSRRAARKHSRQFLSPPP